MASLFRVFKSQDCVQNGKSRRMLINGIFHCFDNITYNFKHNFHILAICNLSSVNATGLSYPNYKEWGILVSPCLSVSHSICPYFKIFCFHALNLKPFDLGTGNFIQVLPLVPGNALFFWGHMGQR